MNIHNLHIVTVATHSDYYFPYLKESCKKNGKELTVLGYGEKWKGFNWKFKLVLNYLNNLNKNDIVCFIDAFDVICVRNLNELIDEFLKIKNNNNCKIFVGEDKYISSNYLIYFTSGLIKYQYGNCKNLQLNSGTYIGYVKDLITALNEIYNLFPIDGADDQVLLTKYCLLNENNVYIDISNKLFLTLLSTYDEIDKYLSFENQNNIIKVKYNNNYPFFIHGPGKTYLDNIIIKLNYNYDYSHKVNKYIYDKSFSDAWFRLKNGNFIMISISIFIFFILIAFCYFLYKFNIPNKKIIIKKNSKIKK